jgi:N-methylhydantoinase A
MLDRPMAENNNMACVLTKLHPLTKPWRIGVDVGGTFTDVVIVDAAGALRSIKSLSRARDPAAGVIAALEAAATATGLDLGGLLSGCDLFVHGSTVATNTLLEGTGAKVGLLVTEGFRDSLEIRRGVLENPWRHRTPYPPVLVPRYLRLPVAERIDRHGREHAPLDPASIRDALAVFETEGVESIAICFLNSYLNPDHEREAARLVRASDLGRWVSVSSEIAPIAGEYVRVSTTAIDAYVAPRLVEYLRTLAAALARNGLVPPMLLVKNNGGTAAVDEVAREPVTLTLSGPAAAVGALRHFGSALGHHDLISIEIGGTSCDVLVMAGGEVGITDRLSIAGYDTVIPSVDIHTVGAGGGALASVDASGVLKVGPQGAGADPGPACYGRGGTEPTLTDAQLVLGRMRAGAYAGGAIVLDATLAERAVTERVARPLGLDAVAAAAGIVRVAEQTMLHAVAYVSTERGLDARNFTLVAGGGAGGLHGATVGRALGCRTVYVPRLGGVLCALGMLNSDVRHDYVRSWVRLLDAADPAEVDRRFAEIEATARETLGREGFAAGRTRLEREIDLRYHGQQWDVRVRLPSGVPAWDQVKRDFERAYERLYGHVQPETPIEIVKLRLAGFGLLPGSDVAFAETVDGTPEPIERRRVHVDESRGFGDVPIYAGRDLRPGHRADGPLVVEEETTTIWVGPGDRLEVDRAGNYLIHLDPDGETDGH